MFAAQSASHPEPVFFESSFKLYARSWVSSRIHILKRSLHKKSTIYTTCQLCKLCTRIQLQTLYATRTGALEFHKAFFSALSSHFAKGYMSKDLILVDFTSGRASTLPLIKRQTMPLVARASAPSAQSASSYETASNEEAGDVHALP